VSFEAVPYWLEIAGDYCQNGRHVVVGTKVDMKDQRAITEEEGRRMAKEQECAYYEVSAKTGEGMQEMFQEIVSQIPYREEMPAWGNMYVEEKSCCGEAKRRPAYELLHEHAGMAHTEKCSSFVCLNCKKEIPSGLSSWYCPTCKKICACNAILS